jgi:hypothetical protein
LRRHGTSAASCQLQAASFLVVGVWWGRKSNPDAFAEEPGRSGVPPGSVREPRRSGFHVRVGLAGTHCAPSRFNISVAFVFCGSRASDCR